MLVWAAGAETIVYDRESHRAHCLSPGAAAVWSRCDGRRTVPQIAAALRDHGFAEANEPLVAAILRRLGRARLLRAPAPPRPTETAERRRLMRGLAAIGGYAVLSITAPTPAEAATCFALGSGCGTSSQCCSGCCSAIGRCVPPLPGIQCRPG